MIKKDQIDLIMESIRVGMNDTDSCAIARVSREWFYDMQKNNPKFLESIKAARAEWKRKNLQIIQKAATEQWQPAAWILERKFPDEFAIKQRHELTGPNGGPIQNVSINLERIDDETLRKLAYQAGDNGNHNAIGYSQNGKS